jgi:predicted HicB family RNase H-like nuclease
MSKYLNMLKEAKKDFANGINWMDFSNKYFGPGNPYIPQDEEERKEFLKSEEYQAIQAMKENLEEGQPEISEPKYSGKFVVRVGASLHRSLVEEAEAEGMSLNQLILAKLAPPLYDRVRGRK